MSRKVSRDRDERLDPIRWHRPSRGTTFRLSAVAVLLITAAGVIWLQPATCAPASTAPEPFVSGSGSPSTPASPPVAQPTTQSTARSIPPGSVGVPVRLADPTALTVVRPGNRVDLLRPAGDRNRTITVATAALVLEVTGADDPVTGGLLLALDPDSAERTVAASGHGFAIVIRPD
ncbi:hypothetical protein [Actinoplanes sp. G11-F43]|uniref:hypothetical protein n=1 Tax=Actinoplanes sp. G11-F43 TaxID=3424130 RepID=UPI003D336B1F